MHELFERPGLYANVHDWLYIFELCAVKSSNESVVESMGNIIDQHAAPGRHLNPEEYAREAFIHWNGPQLHRADRFLAASLNRHFKVSWPGGWRFTNVTRRMEMLNFKHTSKVVDETAAPAKQVSVSRMRGYQQSWSGLVWHLGGRYCATRC